MALKLCFYHGTHLNFPNLEDDKLADNFPKATIKSSSFIALTSQVPFCEPILSLVLVPTPGPALIVSRYTNKNL